MFKSGCLVCGKELKYLNENKKFECQICKLVFDSNVTCEDEHYVCDNCHSQASYISIKEYARQTGSKDPVLIATEMMKNEFVHMHGPEHHFLVIAALLAAYKNAGGEIDLEKALDTAKIRSKSVPGGVCGMWGSCGAAIGTGIYVSIISNATPLSEEEWKLANLMTSKSLYAISQNGGPRCCKRDTLLAILEAIEFSKVHFGIEMDSTTNIKCSFYKNNPTCKKEKCLFYKNHLTDKS